jgi:hypothetical protein
MTASVLARSFPSEGFGRIPTAPRPRTLIVRRPTPVDAADAPVNSPVLRLALRASSPGGVASTALPQ